MLVSQRIERPQDDPYERRILRDGAVWERSSSDAHVESGDMVFETVPLQWREIAKLGPDSVARIEEAARGVLDLPDEHAPGGTPTRRREPRRAARSSPTPSPSAGASTRSA
jgi:hypothetical protein